MVQCQNGVAYNCICSSWSISLNTELKNSSGTNEYGYLLVDSMATHVPADNKLRAASFALESLLSVREDGRG